MDSGIRALRVAGGSLVCTGLRRTDATKIVSCGVRGILCARAAMDPEAYPVDWTENVGMVEESRVGLEEVGEAGAVGVGGNGFLNL